MQPIRLAIIFVFHILIAFSLASCGGSASTDGGSTNNTPPIATPSQDNTPSEPEPSEPEPSEPEINLPATLTATQTIETEVILNWGNFADISAIVDYQVLRGTSDLNLLEIGTSITHNFTDTTASTSTSYYYKVIARNAAEESSSSVIINITTLSAGELADCALTINPGDSFTEAFSGLVSGDILCLNDGIYNQAMDIPSYIHVRAVNDGKAVIDGMSTLGEAWSGGLLQMKGSHSSARGLRVHHAGTNAHTCYLTGDSNTLRMMSCSNGGAHKHKLPIFLNGSNHLVEDSWAFGTGRYVIQCFTGRGMTIRRNVARWDNTVLGTLSEPNAAFSIYNCSDATVENNISLDFGPSGQEMRFGGDFYSPQNPAVWPEGNNNNHYLGNYAINHALGNINRRGLRFDVALAKNNIIKDMYINGSNNGMIISAQDQVNSQIEISNCTFVDIIGDIFAGNYNASCDGEAEIGAKYVDRVKVSNDLFPWPNEALIKEDMCRSGERQSDWCSTDKTLSEYVLGI